MATIPSYLQSAAVERGSITDELVLCLFEATQELQSTIQEQVKVQRRIADALEKATEVKPWEQG